MWHRPRIAEGIFVLRQIDRPILTPNVRRLLHHRGAPRYALAQRTYLAVATIAGVNRDPVLAGAIALNDIEVG